MLILRVWSTGVDKMNRLYLIINQSFKKIITEPKDILFHKNNRLGGSVRRFSVEMWNKSTMYGIISWFYPRWASEVRN